MLLSFFANLKYKQLKKHITASVQSVGHPRVNHKRPPDTKNLDCN